MSAKQAGTYGMAAAISSGTSGYVQDNSPSAEPTYHARFYLNPNNATVSSTSTTIFTGLNSANQTVFTVQLRRTSLLFSVQYAVAATVSTAGGSTTTNWVNIPATGFTAVEIAWQSGTSASFSLYTGGTLRQTLTGQNTSAFTLETVQLGPQGSLTNLSGTIYFDTFASTRTTVIGL
jgi:hypothetical protein